MMSRSASKTALLLFSFGGLLTSLPVLGQHHVFTVHEEEDFVNIPKVALVEPGEDPADIAIVDSPAWLDFFDLSDSILLSLVSGPNYGGWKRTKGVVFSYHTGPGTEERMVLVRVGSAAETYGFRDDLADELGPEWGVPSIDPSIMIFDDSKLTLSFDETSTGVDSRAFSMNPDHNGPSAGAVVFTQLTIADTGSDGDEEAVYDPNALPQATLYTASDNSGTKLVELRLRGEPDAFELTAEAFADACDAPSCATSALALPPGLEIIARVSVHSGSSGLWLALTAINSADPRQTVTSTVALDPTWTGWQSDLEHSFGASEIANFQGTTEVEIHEIVVGSRSFVTGSWMLRAMDNFESCTFDGIWNTSNSGVLGLVTEASPGTGCAASIDMAASNSNSVLLDHSPSWDSKITARFRIDTSKLSMNPGDSVRIWGGRNPGNTQHVQLILQRDQTRYTLQLQARDHAGVWQFGSAAPLNGTSREIHVYWLADAQIGGATFFIDGVEHGEISHIDTSAYRMDIVRFGSALPLVTGEGTLVLDDYVSWP